MSCIAGRLRLDLTPVDPSSAQRMLAAMRSRAPDGDLYAHAGGVALGQALLRTGASAAEGPNRLTLDGKTWLVADARIDDRANLIQQLRRAGSDVSHDAPHAELILHAYRAFGDDFLDHLLGDFAFALWDEPRQRLICARDRFGVRPFYFAEVNGEFLFASDIDALLVLDHVPRDLDETAVVDFLLLGFCMDAERTIYRAVRCLPPASRLDVSQGQARQTRYWTLSPTSEIRFKRLSDYAERFAELFDQAVGDRVPQGPFAISLSGGMDSTSIAAVASRRSSVAISAYHAYAGSLEPEDDEEVYANLVAENLGLRFVRQDLNDYALFARSDDAVLRTAFPSPAPLLSVHLDMLQEMESRSERVLFSGYQGDAVIAPAPTYYSALARAGQWAKLAREIHHHVVNAGSLRGMNLRTIWQREALPPPWKPPLPKWIEPEMARRLALPRRWEDWWRLHQDATGTVPQLRLPWVHRHFELTEILNKPVVGRYPFLDLRLIDFLLALPNFTREDKWVLREAMRGILPEAVRTRPKTGAVGDVVRKLVTKSKLTRWDDLSGLPSFVDSKAYRTAWNAYCAGQGQDSTWASWLILQPAALTTWLKQQQERKQ